MQYQILALATLFSAVMAAPVVEVDLAARGDCSTGFTIETFGSNNCGEFGQGDSNSGSGCSVCVEMGDAQSWKLLNPDHCAEMSVTYYTNANCKGPTTLITPYNTKAQTCNAIPTTIGAHYSASFVCLSG